MTPGGEYDTTCCETVGIGPDNDLGKSCVAFTALILAAGLGTVLRPGRPGDCPAVEVIPESNDAVDVRIAGTGGARFGEECVDFLFFLAIGGCTLV